MISLHLIVLAAIFKSIADTLDEHFEVSIFKKLNPKWWSKNVSWKYVRFLPLTHYRPDAWHLANSAMIISFVLAVVFYQPWLGQWYYDFIAFGFAFNVTFEFFYSKVWK